MQSSAHDVRSGRGHLVEDTVVHTPAKERRLERRTVAATASDAKAAASKAPGDPAQVGQWGPVVDWPVVGVHVALLPNGKVLAYDSVGDRATETYPVHNFTRATVWDPDTGLHQSATVTTGFNIFCSGLAHLVDGTLFAAGGNKNSALNGIAQTHIFNAGSNTWTRGADMSVERWYPSVTPLRNGEMLITEGGPNVPEVRALNGSIRRLDTASLDLPLYPWIDVAPDGRAFYSGPSTTMRSLDPAGGGAWQTHGQRDTVNRDYGSRALFDKGKILVAGGGASTASARVIDLNGPTPQSTATGSMATGRRQHNLTVLADGTVLATGGNSSGASLVDLNNGVYTAEQWNPATGQWRTLASMQVTRQYHSTALLLPDGRVLSSGGGICGECDASGYLAKNAEVFSPPYLFKNDGSGQPAPRPQITSVPGTVSYNAPFSIATPSAGSISKVALVRLGAVTHSVNMEQRYVPLGFTGSGGSITATAPLNANIAPPGVYMLFVIGSDGVPSLAKMVRMEDDTTVPSSPTLTDTDPDSPANDNNPEVKGSAEAGSTVRIYSTATCSGSPLATGSAAAFTGCGITTPVPGDQTTNLRATATASAGNASV
ncbi:MAG: galactose oxidase-like domain-containing protein, partial [Solirubrobacterales bacterium]